KKVRFSNGEKTVSSIPWGDIATAYYSTQIPNIIVYVTQPRMASLLLRGVGVLSKIITLSSIQKILLRQIEKRAPGPSASERSAGRVRMWGKVSHPGGQTREAWLDTEEGYSLTVATALAAVERSLKGQIPAGYLSPSQAFGADFIMSIPTSKLTLL